MVDGPIGQAAARADLAIRLQADPEGGRASAEVAELIAAGVPTIVSEPGWQGELPEPVVLKVAPDSDAEALAARMGEALTSEELRRAVRTAQERFASENSVLPRGGALRGAALAVTGGAELRHCRVCDESALGERGVKAMAGEVFGPGALRHGGSAPPRFGGRRRASPALGDRDVAACPG